TQIGLPGRAKTGRELAMLCPAGRIARSNFVCGDMLLSPREESVGGTRQGDSAIETYFHARAVLGIHGFHHRDVHVIANSDEGGIFSYAKQAPRLLHEIQIPCVVDMLRVHVRGMVLRCDDDTGRNDREVTGAFQANAYRAIGRRIHHAVVTLMSAIWRNDL